MQLHESPQKAGKPHPAAHGRGPTVSGGGQPKSCVSMQGKGEFDDPTQKISQGKAGVGCREIVTSVKAAKKSG